MHVTAPNFDFIFKGIFLYALYNKIENRGIYARHNATARGGFIGKIKRQ